MSKTRKDHEKSSKSSKADETKHKQDASKSKSVKEESKHKKDASKKQSVVASAAVSAPSKAIAPATITKKDETDDKSVSSRVSLLDIKRHDDFSPEYCEKEQKLVHNLDEQVNLKLNKNLAGAPAYLETFLKVDVLSAEVKGKLKQRFLDPIESLIMELTPADVIAAIKDKEITPVKVIAARVSEYTSKLELILKYQQDAAKLQVEIAALPLATPNREITANLHSVNIETIGKTVIAVNDLLTRSTRLLKLINTLNKCLAKPTFQPVAETVAAAQPVAQSVPAAKKSPYAAGGPAMKMNTTKPAEPAQEKPQPEGITTGPSRDGKNKI